jgi:NADH dehydrogenase [ubiquinone] 1 alpha subcomplex assembly factor 1
MPWGMSRWTNLDDGVMGGLSGSHFRTPSSGNSVFEGTVRTENRGGFASVRCTLDGTDAALLDGASTFVLGVRGDGKRYKFSVRTGRMEEVMYQADFATVRGELSVVHVPVTELRPTWRGMAVPGAPQLTSCSQAKSVGLMITKEGGQVGDFAMELVFLAVE